MRNQTILVFICYFSAVIATQSGTLRDNFNDNNVDGWEEITVPLNKKVPFKDWQVIDGELHIADQQDNVVRCLVVGKSKWKNYVLEVDVKPIQALGKNDINLVAHFKDNRSFVCTIGNWTGTPQVTAFQALWVGAVANNQKQKPFDLLKVGKWHHLKLKAEEDDFTIWINDRKMMNYQDPTLQKGQVGFCVSNYIARFDNVVIVGPDVPDINQGLSIDKAGKLANVWAKLKTNQ